MDSITPADCRKRGKTIEAPSGGKSKPRPLSPVPGVLLPSCGLVRRGS
ncbi:MAG: hypothetical protein OES18_06715 [Deltaproteobacteria bacterium]|nr:hypothetical protein [Deltaproteobacteria bacterium]